MSEGSCDDDLLSGPAASLATLAFAVRGFAALWRGERPLVAELADDDTIVEALVAAGRAEVDDEGRLVAVHGVVARPTAHRIEHPGGVVHTWCALDAIGIPAALGIDATAVTSCPVCGAELTVVLRGGVPDGGTAYPLWIPDGETHLVEDFCRHANLFCSDEHVSARPAQSTGQAVTVAEAATIGRGIWRDVALAPRAG